MRQVVEASEIFSYVSVIILRLRAYLVFNHKIGAGHLAYNCVACHTFYRQVHGTYSLMPLLNSLIARFLQAGYSWIFVSSFHEERAIKSNINFICLGHESNTGCPCSGHATAPTILRL